MSTAQRAALPRIQRHRGAIRVLAAAASTLVALVYVLIGVAGLVRPEDIAPAPSEGGLLYFGMAAALAFVFGAILLAALDRRILWILGAAVQLFAIVAYNALAGQRATPFEFWGLLVEALQIVILAALVALAIGQDEKERGIA